MKKASLLLLALLSTFAYASNETGPANTVLRVPSAGGRAQFGAVDLTQSAAVTGALPIGKGGTGAATKAGGFDALSPMTTAGDVIYGGASGTGTRLAVGSAYKKLQSDGTNPAWSFGECADNGSEGAGTTTLTIASNPCQSTTLSAGRTYTLPTTSVPDGYIVRIVNKADFDLTINASGGAAVAILDQGSIVLMANQATPTTKAHWTVLAFTSYHAHSTTFTFNGSGCTGAATSSPATVVNLRRNMDFVSIDINGPVATSCTSSTQFNANTALPAHFIPAIQQVIAYNSSRNSGGATSSAGGVFLRTDGVIRLTRDTSATAWSNGASCGFQDDVAGVYYSPL